MITVKEARKLTAANVTMDVVIDRAIREACEQGLDEVVLDIPGTFVVHNDGVRLDSDPQHRATLRRMQEIGLALQTVGFRCEVFSQIHRRQDGSPIHGYTKVAIRVSWSRQTDRPLVNEATSMCVS